MQKRLVSQNMINCNNAIKQQFDVYGPLVSYCTQFFIKIQCINKQIKDGQIKIQSKQVNKIMFSLDKINNKVYLVIDLSNGNIDIYQIKIIINQIKSSYFTQLKGHSSNIISSGISYFSQKNILKAYNYQQNKQISIKQINQKSQFIQHQGNNIAIITPLQKQKKWSLKIFNKKSNNQYQQSSININQISQPISIFKDSYLFMNNAQKKQIQIINLYQIISIGKIQYQGDFIKGFIKSNLLVIITAKQNMDKYYFFSIGQNGIPTHRTVYQKGKASFHNIFECQQSNSNKIVQPRKDQVNIQRKFLKSFDQKKSLIVYVLPQKKNKIQLTVVQQSKIKQQTNSYTNLKSQNQSLNNIIKNKTKIIKQSKKTPLSQTKTSKQSSQIQDLRIRASLDHRKGNDNADQIQKKLIQQVVNVKIGSIMKKFEDLQTRLVKIQNQISNIYQKIQKSIQNINRKQVKRNVQCIFERVTPQFQSYFTQIFQQLSSVLDQGFNYYTSKLNKQSQIHHQAINKLVHMTFDATTQIISLGRKQLGVSQKIGQVLNQIMKTKQKWNQNLQNSQQNLKISKPNQSNLTTKINLSDKITNNSGDKKKDI